MLKVHTFILQTFKIMAKLKIKPIGTLEVQGTTIQVIGQNDKDYISLTDMTKGFGDDSLIYSWMRNRNTVEFLALWEELYNPGFNSNESVTFKTKAGLNSFNLTPRKWIEATNAIGIISKSGRYNGGTFAQKDIALEFGSWLSPTFKLYMIKEFQRLKEAEAEITANDWSVNRVLAKVNYRVHTDAIKNDLLPLMNIPKAKQGFIYADEADLLNIALFGMTAREWKQNNSDLTLQGMNIRDTANLYQLTVLSNLESYNSILIKRSYPKEARLQELRKLAVEQLESFYKANNQSFEALNNPKLNKPI